MPFLKQVQYQILNSDKDFIAQFLKFLSPVGKVNQSGIEVYRSEDNLWPTTFISFRSIATPKVNFILNNEDEISVNISNTTKISKTSPHNYSPVSMDEFSKRISHYKLISVDHTGFNLPYFDGIHPEILELREKLKNICLYHTFPKQLEEDAPWDFILPGTEEEISGEKEVNYSLNRKPKIEIVSFDKSSTPLIQIEVQLGGNYEDWVKIFPEAINISELRSLCIYITNDSGIDICFVLNEIEQRDWSYHFTDSRLR